MVVTGSAYQDWVPCLSSVLGNSTLSVGAMKVQMPVLWENVSVMDSCGCQVIVRLQNTVMVQLRKGLTTKTYLVHRKT